MPKKIVREPILNLSYIERKNFTKYSFPVPKQMVDCPDQPTVSAVTQIAIQLALQKTTIVILCNIIFEQVHVYQVHLPVLVEET